MKRLATGLLALWLAFFAAPASAQTHEWYLKVGSWNLLNFGIWKATNDDNSDRVALLTRMGQIAAAYDIVIFQEVLQDGASVTQHLVNYMPGYACNWMSAESGRTGRKERYAICAKPQVQWGTIAISPLTDYSTAQQNFLAANNSQQAAQQVWMRPPVIARVTFTPSDTTFPPFVFDIYTIHTKPAYGKTIPAGAPPTPPNNSSVHYELEAVERNLSPAPASANRMLIGDLNADCAFYPPARRGTDFTTWTWFVGYGERTTTALNSSCGYDKIILNPAIYSYRRRTGVEYPGYGNTTRLNDRRISDHYPVWVEFFQQRQDRPGRKRSLSSAGSIPVGPANKQAKYSTTDTVNIAGTSLPASQPNGQVVVAMTDAALSFKSNLRFRLTDVRGQPSLAPTDANGDFSTVTWRNPTAGAFTFVFDANGDGWYDRADGDFANEDSQADIYVTASSAGHSDLLTLGDNIVARDIFNLALAKNVYLVGKNLPASFTGNAYILSWKLLRAAGYRNWTAARTAQIDLPTYAIPIQRNGGMIQTSALTPDERRQPFSTNPRGELFMSVWSKPAQLMNATVNYQTPPDGVFVPGEAGDGDPPASPRETDYVEDVCAAAYKWGADSNLRKACNSGFGFGSYYGSDFSVVLDVDNDGKLSTPDKVDDRDIGDMTTYFNGPGATALGPNANGNPAVGEYKEYLSRALSVDLSAGDIFDADTQNASARYACDTALSKAAFQTWIVPDSQTGFRVLEQANYRVERAQTSGIRQFADEYVDEEDFVDSDVCINANSVTYAGPINLSQGSNVTAIADEHRFEEGSLTATDSHFCIAAVNTTAAGALAFGTGATVATAGSGVVVGVATVGAAAAIEVLGRLGCGIISLFR